MADEVSVRPQRHPEHWDIHGTHVFQVGNTLYQLDSKTLSRVSGMFAEMFNMPQSTDPTYIPDGTESHPIIINTSIGEPEFDLFIALAYGKYVPPPYTNDVLVRLLHLGRFFLSESTHMFALHNIDARKWNFNPAHLIQLCFEFNTQLFFVHAFSRLVKTSLLKFRPEDKAMMGPIVYHAVAEVRESLDDHRRTIACEAPIITSHAYDCINHEQCNDDWYAVWWNGMARYLLDGRHPLSYDEAFKRFELLEFGMMGPGCKQSMLALVREGAAFRHNTRFVETTGMHLLEKLIPS